MKKTFLICSLLSSVFFNFAQATSVVTCGDSLMASYSDTNVHQGWGKELPKFTKNMTVYNDGHGGSTIRSFYQNLWQKSLARKTNFAFIAFVWNDEHKEIPSQYVSPSNFKSYLTTYVSEARKQKTEPYFVTPPRRCHFNGNEPAYDAKEYSDAMKSVAAQLKVGIIDLDTRVANLLRQQGQTACKNYYYQNNDFSQAGAVEIASLVAAEAKLIPALKPYFK